VSAWHWIEESLLKQNREIDEKIVAEEQERIADREAAVRQRGRNAKKPAVVRLASGDEAHIYRGAYIHAYSDDGEAHSYGVIVRISGGGCYISAPNISWDERIEFKKYDHLEALDEPRWGYIELKLTRRRKEDRRHRGCRRQRKSDRVRACIRVCRRPLVTKKSSGARPAAIPYGHCCSRGISHLGS
jgi:hypothetical protein